ncbi:glucosaminidase domain-containing protein [Neobacillus kokaensis]|uniref:glucosaminidase domain-containing protein n=1 Tax=Neobacillus kokaensis TaxID=2759023 RepID=UPI001CB8BC6E|nr:glucosaminidase domain-containing protein [Neobacillus kokaensis]
MSTNWLLFKTMMDISRIGQGNRTNLSGLNSGSFELLLQQVLLQAEMNQQSNSGLDALQFTGLNRLPSVIETATSQTKVLQTTNRTSLTDAAKNDGDKLDLYLKGVLQNTGHHFAEAGEKYQINPALLAAISIHETGNGTSNAARFKYNVAGMMGKNGLKSYDSIRDSIFDMARNLRQNYLDQGKQTIAQIGAKYAPIGASNDPTQLNNHWVTGVQSQFHKLTGKTGLA